MRNEPPGGAPIAEPAGVQRYVIPGSHYLDPPYSWQLSETWPRPRTPGAFESESRAPGTGMISSGAGLPTRNDIARIPPPKPASSIIAPGPRPSWPVISTDQVAQQRMFRGK